jgi:4-aminobutyrate aminotransferase-like enzyme
VRRHSQTTLRLLARFESQNVTFVEPDGSWPIVWERAKGSHVWDADGRKYLDLTAAFGVASAGHANPNVVRAGQHQMGKLLHAMGDVHPHPLKALLARELSRVTFERWAGAGRTGSFATGKSIFCNSGFEAVEAALKTALLATGKPGVVAFRRGYHGLGYGALNATHRDHFRSPFRSQLKGFADFVDFPSNEEDLGPLRVSLDRLLAKRNTGAILVEPVQTRGGINVPPPGFLFLLRQMCDEHGTLMVLDEIYTGFGRTGRWFACEHWKVVPDIICLGKALTGGFPMSACVGKTTLMDQAWPRSSGEAIHTSTFLGHPVGCAMALAQIQEIRQQSLPDRAAILGADLLRALKSLSNPAGVELNARGLGLLAGVELLLSRRKPATELSLALVKGMLERGYILLPEGADANVISFTPPLTIARQQLLRAVSVLESLLGLSRSRT